uniref:Uncharacterized protein n=1 Tax=Strigamia maritima TaxID=126957 RepID=T1JMN1_STRMM
MFSSKQSTLFYLLTILGMCALFWRVESQQFYPNGRYGRSDKMPALSDVRGTREMTVSFFGDGTVQCTYTGYPDFYRCK